MEIKRLLESRFKIKHLKKIKNYNTHPARAHIAREMVVFLQQLYVYELKNEKISLVLPANVYTRTSYV